MHEIAQKSALGCGVACTASILGMSYQEAEILFLDGRRKAKEIGFYCREIVEVLARAGLDYDYKLIEEIPGNLEFVSGDIVFLRKSEKYPNGHYLLRERWNRWMDPWYNFPNEDRKAGSLRELPEEPIYIIYPVDTYRRNLRRK